MLQAFRTHKRWMMLIAMVFIIPSFVVTGIYSYNRMMDDSNDVAEIGGKTITLSDVDQAKRAQLDQLRQQLGQHFDPTMLDNQQANAMILDALLSERALQLQMLNDYVLVSEASAIDLIKSIPNFQRDGKFSPQAYQQFLNAVGKSDQMFVQELRRDMAQQLLQGGVTNSVIVNDTMARHVFTLMREQRKIETLTLKPEEFKADVKVSDKEIADYYAKHQEQFTVPENVDVQYVVFSPEVFSDIQPSEEDIKGFYEQNLQRFQEPEQRRASHILVADEAQAKTLMEQLKKDPSRFATLAKAQSKDLGSAQNGGDLGWFGRGMMVPSFEKAVFENAKGALVGPVKSDFGYHIISVTDIKSAHTLSIKQAREQIIALYKQQAALRAFAEEAENFSNMVYEQSESLQPVMEKYALKAHVVKNVTRDYADDLLTKNVVSAIYAYDTLQDKRNTAAVEVARNTMVAARVIKHEAEKIRPLSEVKAQLKEQLIQEKAFNAAVVAGEAKVQELNKGARIAMRFADQGLVSRSEPKQVDYAVVEQAMRVVTDKLPVYTGVKTQDGYVLIHVLGAVTPSVSDADVKAAKAELQHLYASVEYQAYMNGLKQRFEAKILKDEYRPQ